MPAKSAIGAVKIDPTDPETIWMGTADGRQGQSNVNGGSVPPPGAPPLGVYVSHDGGTSFTREFSLPDDLSPGQEEDGGVTDIEFDPVEPTTVYASLLDGVVWRTDATDDVAVRRTALTALTDSAVRATGWRVLLPVAPATVPFPGS